MNKISVDGVVVGKVLGYTKGWNLLSHETSVVVSVENKKVMVSIDARQQKFIQKEYPRGSRVAIGFYDGMWHIGSRPSAESQFKPETSVAFLDVLNTLKSSEPLEQ